MQEFLSARRRNLEAGCQHPIFTDLIGSLDRAYRAVIDNHDPSAPQIFGRIVLICHRSLLSAASLVAQLQPDDSVGVTRRAVEAAKVALAIKLDDDNARQWVSFQERHDRWIKRQLNEKPKSFHVKFKGLTKEPLVNELDRYLGILSDASGGCPGICRKVATLRPEPIGLG